MGWWWVDTASVHGLSGWLIGAGRVTGLGSGYAMAVLLVKGPAPQRRTAPAMARTPSRSSVEATLTGSRELQLSRAA